MDLCSCRSRSDPELSLRLQGGAFSSEKRGTGGGRGKEDMRVRMLEKFGGAPSFKLGQTLQPQDVKYETGKREEERWCVKAWQLSHRQTALNTNNSGMIQEAKGMQRTQQVKAFYPHRF
ncbi:unnamed protein product [Coccothraustes coccothraustes]